MLFTKHLSYDFHCNKLNNWYNKYRFSDIVIVDFTTFKYERNCKVCYPYGGLFGHIFWQRQDVENSVIYSKAPYYRHFIKKYSKKVERHWK